MFALRGRLGSPSVLGGVRVAHRFSFQSCVFCFVFCFVCPNPTELFSFKTHKIHRLSVPLLNAIQMRA
jgi:hypothetical protein